jgi:hypothetical protein
MPASAARGWAAATIPLVALTSAFLVLAAKGWTMVTMISTMIARREARLRILGLVMFFTPLD